MDNNKILLVEDDESVSLMYQIGFKNAGFEVYTAKDGKEGLDMAKKVKPDIILLDIRMPLYDGYWMLAKVKEEKALKGVPILALTNIESNEEQDAVLQCGAAEYLSKVRWTPSNELIQKVKDYISATAGTRKE